MPSARLQRWFPPFAALALIGAILGVYSPGLHGPFMFDDHVNIVHNPDIAMPALEPEQLERAARAGISGVLGRPLAYLSFGINHALAGGYDATFPFKLTNVLLHGVNALLVLWLSHLLFAQLAHRQGREPRQHERWLPFLAAALWALHPLQLTSVLYVVQRMTSLSALFVLAGLIAYVTGRRLLRSRPGFAIFLMTAGILGGTGLGLLAKESAILLLPYAVVIELTLFSGRDRPWHRNAIRRAAYVAAAGAGILLLGLWASGLADWIASGYDSRHFTLTERLLTEARVLWFYLGLLFLPGTGRFTLFHDDFTLSTGLLDPWTTLPAALGLAGLLVAGVMLRRRYPMAAFAVLWFLAGHSLESGFIALELVHEHRNYLPSLGPLAALVYGLAVLARGRERLLPAAGLALAAVLAFTTFVLATNWRDDDSLARFMLRHHPESARTHEAMAGIYLREHRDPIMAMEHYRIAAELAPYENSYLVKLVLTAAESRLEGDVAGMPPGPVSPPAAGPAVWKLLRIEQQEQGAALVPAPALHDRIARQLASQPITVGVYIVFNEVVDCIMENPSQCGHLRQHAGSWLEIAIDNPRSPVKVKLQLMQLLVRLHLGEARLAAAQTMSERALAISPMNPALVLMHANVLFLSGKLDEAEQGLRLFEGAAPPGHEHEWGQAEYLRFLIRQRRSP